MMLMTLISSAESDLYSLISIQQIKKGIEQRKPLLLRVSGFCLNLQSDMLEILLFEMTVSSSGLEEEWDVETDSINDINRNIAVGD